MMDNLDKKHEEEIKHLQIDEVVVSKRKYNRGLRAHSSGAQWFLTLVEAPEPGTLVREV